MLRACVKTSSFIQFFKACLRSSIMHYITAPKLKHPLIIASFCKEHFSKKMLWWFSLSLLREEFLRIFLNSVIWLDNHSSWICRWLGLLFCFSFAFIFPGSDHYHWLLYCIIWPMTFRQGSVKSTFNLSMAFANLFWRELKVFSSQFSILSSVVRGSALCLFAAWLGSNIVNKNSFSVFSLFLVFFSKVWLACSSFLIKSVPFPCL